MHGRDKCTASQLEVGDCWWIHNRPAENAWGWTLTYDVPINCQAFFQEDIHMMQTMRTKAAGGANISLVGWPPDWLVISSMHTYSYGTFSWPEAYDVLIAECARITHLASTNLFHVFREMCSVGSKCITTFLSICSRVKPRCTKEERKYVNNMATN